VTVVSKVSTPTGAITAPAATPVLFAPISIVNIYNQMMNNQPVGWGRSLINVTVYNPLAAKTQNYVFQLNFTGPGPLTVNFLPAVQIFSADQLAHLKPVVGWYEFTGSSNKYKFNYTIVILTTQRITGLTEYWPTGHLPTIAPYAPAVIQTVNYYLVGAKKTIGPVYVYAFTFIYVNGPIPNNNPFGQDHVINNIEFETPAGPIRVPVTYVFINSTSTDLEISPLSWSTINYQVYYNNFNLTIQPKLQLTPIPVTTQLTTASYEEVPASAFSSLGNNQYSGFLLTTPPGSNGITATYYLTGNDTISSTTALTYVTALGTMKYVQNGNFRQQTANYQPVDALSVEGVIVTPAYPSLNGTAFTGLVVNVETYTTTMKTATYDYVNININATTTVASVPGHNRPYQVVVTGSNLNGLNPNGVSLGSLPPLIYSQEVYTGNLPAVQTISPSVLQGIMSVSPNQFYQALVDLGL